MSRHLMVFLVVCLLAVPVFADDTSTHCDKRCVTGADNIAYCVAADVALERWPQMDGCEGGQNYCETMAVQGGFETHCYPICSGNYCYFV
jgi:DhnA family fructose-bisphosphate aldolase class Ia